MVSWVVVVLEGAWWRNKRARALDDDGLVADVAAAEAQSSMPWRIFHGERGRWWWWGVVGLA